LSDQAGRVREAAQDALARLGVAPSPLEDAASEDDPGEGSGKQGGKTRRD
jgi:hypothetical protein